MFFLRLGILNAEQFRNGGISDESFCHAQNRRSRLELKKSAPLGGVKDAVCKPLAVATCTSEYIPYGKAQSVNCHNLILGHECCAEVVEVGSEVRDFKPGDRVLVPAITPDWSSLEAQDGYAMHSGGMLCGWKFSNIKDGVFAGVLPRQ